MKRLPVTSCRLLVASSQEIYFIHLTGNPEGGVDEAYVAVGLREVAPLGAIYVYVFAEDAQVVTKFEQPVEVSDGIICAAYAGQCIHIPEGAYEEGGFGETKIVVMLITIEQPMIGQQFFFQGSDVVARTL